MFYVTVWFQKEYWKSIHYQNIIWERKVQPVAYLLNSYSVINKYFSFFSSQLTYVFLFICLSETKTTKINRTSF